MTDMVAADRVGAEVMGIDPAWVGYLHHCAQTGLGQFDPGRIELRGGVSIDSVRRKSEVPDVSLTPLRESCS